MSEVFQSGGTGGGGTGATSWPSGEGSTASGTGTTTGTSAAVASYLGDDVGLASHADGGGYYYKKNELLVAEEDLSEVEGLLRAMREKIVSTPVRVDPRSRWFQLHLGKDSSPVPELVTELRANQRPGGNKPPFRVSPNHVMYGNSHPIFPGTGSPPRPAQEALAPPPPPADADGAIQVALLDTGDFYKHEWLEGRVEKITKWGTSTDPDDLPGYGMWLPRYAGHGTFCSGLILQHAPRAKVVVGKILNERGQASDSTIAAAVRGLPPTVRVALMSVAGPTHGNIGTPLTEEALGQRWAEDPNLQVVAPAGNNPVGVPWFPGAIKGVISVAALGAEGRKKATFSNFGSWVDACAPGVDVKSTFLTYEGKLYPRYDADPATVVPTENFEGWAYWSGSCFAAARVAGAIAHAIAGGLDGAEAAFRVVGAGQKRLWDDEYDLGVPVFALGWS